MQTFINVVVTLILLPWPILLMMSPMMFDAPGSENSKNALIDLILILCYPVGIAVLYWLFGARYFGISGLTFTIISSVIVFSALSLFGFPERLQNLQKGITNSGYSVAENKVYYNAKPVEAADSESFHIFDAVESVLYMQDYARDKGHFYYLGNIVEGVTVDGLRRETINDETYWLNQNQVIYDDKILRGADPDNFSGFDGYPGWTHSVKDGQFIVFSYGDHLPIVDKESFTPLNEFYAKDKNQVFEKSRPILTEADAESFEFVDHSEFARDKDHVYYLSTEQPFAIAEADPESFEILDRGYAKDKNHVYHVIQYQSVEILRQADVSSFEVTKYDEKTKAEARDNRYLYNNGKVIGDRE